MIDWRPVQTRLNAAGVPCGAVDGDDGPRTWTALFNLLANPHATVTAQLGAKAATGTLAGYLIDTPLRLAHFMGQTAHESGGYLWMHEIWGPTAAQRHYDGRADLGNTYPGDGSRYRGRGLIQLTGRANYAAAGKRLRLDLIGSPEMAERPDVALLVACDFWQQHGLNALADADDIDAVTRRINGGLTGLASRILYTKRAKAVLIGD